MLQDRLFITRVGVALAGLFLTVVLLVAFLPLLSGLLDVLTMLFVTAIITLLLMPLADRLERRRVPRLATVLGVYLIVTVVAGIIALLVLMPLLDSLALLSTSQANDDIAKVVNSLEQVLGPGVAAPVAEQQGLLAGLLQWASGTSLAVLGRLGGLALNLLIICVLVLYLVVDRSIATTLLSLVPAQHRPRAARVTGNIATGLGRWMLAQLGISTYYTVTYIVINVVLGVPYGVTIGVVSGLLEFIPYLGNIVGTILTTLAALTVSPQTAFLAWLAGVFFGIIGGNIVAPYLLGRAARVHPVAIIIGLMIGNLFGGFIGILLAMPVIVILVILIDELRTPRPDETPLPTGAQALAVGRAAVDHLVGDERRVETGD